MRIEMLYIAVTLLFCCLLAILDIRSRVLPNKLLLVLLISQLLFLGIDAINIVPFIIIMAFGLLTFALGYIGAGDVKYAAILALALPLPQLVEALMLTAYSGGVLILFYYLKHRMTPGSLIQDVTLPYGVAISVGFFLTIASHQLQSQQLL
ncbi:prepilin peptidase [Vibrio nomapromontoriensis]|uniref:prepilin peptidase n=1 Tax=Vibrio nomapromontoriensis TaxID=2910246 RepID=UPI003D14714A